MNRHSMKSTNWANMVTDLWLFSTGMHDNRVKMLIDWQEVSLGYSTPCSVLPTAVCLESLKHIVAAI